MPIRNVRGAPKYTLSNAHADGMLVKVRVTCWQSAAICLYGKSQDISDAKNVSGRTI